MVTLNYMVKKCTGGYQFTKSSEKFNHLIYMDVIMLFTKNEKVLKTLIQTIRIYCQDIAREFDKEKMYHVHYELWEEIQVQHTEYYC